MILYVIDTIEYNPLARACSALPSTQYQPTPLWRALAARAHYAFKTGVVVGADTINYTYDAIGNLTSDVAESIGTIDWFVNGKIRSIDRSITPTIDQPDLTFAYGPDGQRIRKAVTWSTGGDTTWYVRDAQGNTMAVYLQRNDSIFAQEHYMYGSSRLGSSAQWTYVSSLTPHADTNRFARVLGYKNYELTNHLGNVLTTISDQKKAIQDGTTGTIAYWTADVVSYSDYYPFGMMMTGRNGSSMDDYRYGFNGKERDEKGMGGGGATYDYGFRIYNPQIGKFLSVDPLFKEYPWYTPYQFAGNMPIWAIDLDGLEARIMNHSSKTVTFVTNVYIVSDGPGTVPSSKIIKAIDEEIVNNQLSINSQNKVPVGNEEYEVKFQFNFITEDPEGNPLTYRRAKELNASSSITVIGKDGKERILESRELGVIITSSNAPVDEEFKQMFGENRGQLFRGAHYQKNYNLIIINSKNIDPIGMKSDQGDISAHEIGHFLKGELNKTDKELHPDESITSNSDQNRQMTTEDLEIINENNYGPTTNGVIKLDK